MLTGALCQKVNGTLNEESAWQHLCRKHLWLNLMLILFVFSDPLLKSTAQVLEGWMQQQVLAFQ